LDFFLCGNDFEMFCPWSLFSKGKEKWCKKANNPFEGVKNIMTIYNNESLDVIIANLNIDIPKAPPICKGGGKMNKVSYRTMCVEVAKTTHVCVNVLEVGKDKLSCQELAQKLAINDNEIIKVLFKKGIAIVMNWTLD
jgi:hypothetical protein